MDKKSPDCLIEILADYKKVECVEQAFTDSTHHLWRLRKSNSDQKNHFLKVCSNTDSPFWQVMDELFDFELRNEIISFSETYDFIGQTCSLEIPQLIKSGKCENDNLSECAFILTSELKGSALSLIEASSNKGKQQIRQFAKHLAELHSKTKSTWGPLNGPSFESVDWSTRLRDVLVRYAKKGGGVILDSDLVIESGRFVSHALDKTFDEVLGDILGEVSKIQPAQFVPVMPDLRWDQFLHIDGVITALVDLDAFVYAPRELDFVILEYLLLPEQVDTFRDEYLKYHDIPKINAERNAYRLLLFYMKILGEEDLNAWMNKEPIF